MSNKKKLLPHTKRDIDYIIVDDLDDNNIAVSPEIADKRLKWLQSSIFPNPPATALVGDDVLVYADIAGEADHKVEAMVASIDGKIHILEVKHELNRV
ncbi:MAG: hypothetical protein RL662_5 [Bacteroidota bacterium]|jgi:hypothetical protein